MNKSISKIRHIQESNKRLEGRLLKEQAETNCTTIVGLIPKGFPETISIIDDKANTNYQIFFDESGKQNDWVLTCIDDFYKNGGKPTPKKINIVTEKGERVVVR